MKRSLEQGDRMSGKGTLMRGIEFVNITLTQFYRISKILLFNSKRWEASHVPRWVSHIVSLMYLYQETTKRSQLADITQNSVEPRAELKIA